MATKTDIAEVPDILALAQRLAHARRSGTVIASEVGAPLPLPADETTAYAIQHAILKINGSWIAGWKVGAKSPDGPITTAPLPAEGIHSSGVEMARECVWPCGLELEVAFKFGETFLPRAEPYSDADVHEALAWMGATIEVVGSRYHGWPDMNKWAMLADLQSHGALIVGEFVPYRADFPFASPDISFCLNDTNMISPDAKGRGLNPAGNPRRLLTWLVNHITRDQGLAVTPEMVMTTGSYMGMFRAETSGKVRGEIIGLPPVAFTLS